VHEHMTRFFRRFCWTRLKPGINCAGVSSQIPPFTTKPHRWQSTAYQERPQFLLRHEIAASLVAFSLKPSSRSCWRRTVLHTLRYAPPPLAPGVCQPPKFDHQSSRACHSSIGSPFLSIRPQHTELVQQLGASVVDVARLVVLAATNPGKLFLKALVLFSPSLLSRLATNTHRLELECALAGLRSSGH